MTQVPEIGAKNRYQKPGTTNRNEDRALSYLLPKTSTKKFGTKQHVGRARNQYQFSGTDCW